MTNTYETILLDIEPPFATLTLNRPERRNAMSVKMIGELVDVLDSLRDNREIRGIIVTGAGGTFCAGGDAADLQLTGTPNAHDTHALGRLDAAMTAFQHIPQIVIARIEGAALGGGLGLVCVADVAVAAATAEFGLPEVQLGIVPSLISPYVIQRLGLMRAKELMLTGRRFDGVSAHEYGLVHEVCPAEVLDVKLKQVMDWVRQCNPNAVATCKQLIFEVMGKEPAATYDYRVNLLNEMLTSDDAREGFGAFREKRKPRWAQ